MQLAKVQLARAIWLFDTGELNPYGTSIFPALIYRAVDRYGFRKYPDPKQFTVSNSLRLEFGQFVENGSAYEASIEIFNDGITADTRHSTSISELFLWDVVKWACGEFGFTFTRQMAKKHRFRSELILYGDRGLAALCETLDKMSDIVSKVTGESTELTALTFGTDGKGKASIFSFERKLDEPFGNLKYYSAAQMQTMDHIKVLNEFGQILSPGSPCLLGQLEEPANTSIGPSPPAD